jgi:molybdopterin synthase catalytic subunit
MNEDNQTPEVEAETTPTAETQADQPLTLEEVVRQLADMRGAFLKMAGVLKNHDDRIEELENEKKALKIHRI